MAISPRRRSRSLGAESTYGGASRARGAREVILKIAVRHASQDALKIFAREIFPAATAMAQGLTGFSGGRPEPQPVVRLFSFLIDKSEVARPSARRRANNRASRRLRAARSRRAARLAQFERGRSARQRSVRARAADCARPWPQRRQGRQRQHRRDRPTAGIRAGASRRADGGGGAAPISPIMRSGRSSASTGPGSQRFQLPAASRARRRRRRLAAPRSARQGARTGADGFSDCRARRLAGAGRPARRLDARSLPDQASVA